MSVVCAAIKGGEVAIAADTRTSYGSLPLESRVIELPTGPARAASKAGVLRVGGAIA